MKKHTKKTLKITVSVEYTREYCDHATADDWQWLKKARADHNAHRKARK